MRVSACAISSWLLYFSLLSIGDGFLSPLAPRFNSRDVIGTGTGTTALFGAFNKRNKQSDLRKKMEEAKRQRQIEDDPTSGEALSGKEAAAKNELSNAELKRINDQKRFEQLLDSESATINYDLSGNSNNYMTKEQEEEEIDAGFRGVDRLFEGDTAKEEPFQDLVLTQSGNALGEAGAKRVIPWLNKNAVKQTDYLIIVSDPRPKSTELRNSMKRFVKLPPEILSHMIIINADTPAENRRFLKKNGLSDLDVYCDEKREWMREYTVLGEKRWAMCLIVVGEGRVQRLVRELDGDSASLVVKNSVSSL